MTFVLIFLISFISSAQITSQKIPLKELFTQLEQEHQCTFTYADDLIRDIVLTPPPQNLSLAKALSYIKRQTQLNFTILANNFIAVTLRDDITTTYLCGYILDDESGEPLVGAAIIGQSAQVITDEFGYFELEVNTISESLSIRYLGYYVKSFEASELTTSNECSNITLVPQIETLSEIVLRNFLVQGIDKVADGTFSINFSNFGVLPGLIESDVLQTIQSLPGVSSVSETVSDINIRGGTNDQNLILWDGIRMYQSGHFFGLISVFNPQMTISTQLIKNGTDAKYSDGVSGTIAMKTDDKISNKFAANIGVNFINADALIDIPLGSKSSLQLASLRWVYRPSDNDFIKMSGLLVNNKLVFNESALVDQAEISKASELVQETFAGGFTYNRKWNDAFATTVNITGSKYTIDALNANVTEEQTLEQKNTISETALKLNSFYEYSQNLSIEAGYHFTETGITNFSELDRPPFLLSVKEVIREHSIFSQLRYTSNAKNTFIKLGGRYNFIDFLDNPARHRIEPRLSVVHKFNENLTVEVLGEFKHQYTAQIIRGQDDFLGIERRRWILINNEAENIPIITSRQVSTGLTFNKKGWLASADAYYKDVEGISTLGQGFVNQYVNSQATGSYEVIGLDVLINRRFQKINMWLTYSLAHNDYTFNELDLTQFPNNIDIRHTVGFGASYNHRKLKVSTGFNWHSGLPDTLPDSETPVLDNTINYEHANSSRLDEYLRFDVSASYDFKIGKAARASTGISFWNITNNRNTIKKYYQLVNDEPEEVRNNALALTPNFVFRVFF